MDGFIKCFATQGFVGFQKEKILFPFACTFDRLTHKIIHRCAVGRHVISP